jgi:hypothetical protein
LAEEEAPEEVEEGMPDAEEHPAVASAPVLARPAIRRTLVRRGMRIMARSSHRRVVAAVSPK